MRHADKDIISRFPVGYYEFHPNVSLNFQLNRFWGWCGEKQMFDELREVSPRIKSYDDWVREMFALGERALSENRSLPAAYYFKAAVFFTGDDDPRNKPAIDRFCHILLSENKVSESECYSVPYQNCHLSAYRLKPDQPLGTIIIFGGFDSYILEWLPAAVALRDAGLDTIIFDGPGQGTVLDAGLTMTPDWHLPVTAILDYFKVSDVTLLGFSLGGLVLRAAARELRIRRAICFDVCNDLFEVFIHSLKISGLDKIAENSDQMLPEIVNAAVMEGERRDLLSYWAFAQGKRVMGAAAPAEVLKALRSYHTKDIASLVEQDVLLMAGTGDHYIPLKMLGEQMGDLVNARSITARTFTRQECAQNHCQIGNVGLALEVILDWMDQTGGRK